MGNNKIRAIDITLPIRRINSDKPLDFWYGPYNDIDECIELTQGNRYSGLTVGIKQYEKDENGANTQNYKIVDYVFHGGITKDDLIEKIYFNPNSQQVQDIFTEKENNIIGKIQVQIPTLENNTITFPNMSGKTINLLQESDITGLSLDKFTNIKETLDGKFQAVDNNFTQNNTLMKEVQNGLKKANQDITNTTATLTTLREENTHRFSHYDELIATTQASIEETSDTVAVTGMGGLNNDINHTMMDRSLIELEQKIASMERIPESAVLAAINNTDTYKFARIVKYDTIASKDIPISDKIDIIRALFNKLNNDTIEDNKYIYIFEDSNKPSTVNYQFSCYYVSQGSQVRELQFKRQFTNSEFTQYQEQEQGATVAGTTKTPYELEINGKKCQYYLNSSNTEYTENILKIYSTSYNWKLVTKLYDKNNDKYLELLTHDTTGDNIADVNEQYYEVDDVHNNDVINFEYILKDEYKQEGENSYIYNTIAKLTNNGEINTKTIYLICYKDGRLKNDQAEEYGFYFQPYVWYNGSVYRLNTTVTMGYTFTGQNWEYTDPVDIREGVENYTGNVDDVLYITETQSKTTEKVISVGSPAQDEINQIIINNNGLDNTAIVSKTTLHQLLSDTYSYVAQILNNRGINRDKNDVDGELYQLSNYFTFIPSYQSLEKNQKQYINTIDSLLFGCRKMFINQYLTDPDSNMDYIKLITYGLVSTIFKNGLHNELLNHYGDLLQNYYNTIKGDDIFKNLDKTTINEVFNNILQLTEVVDEMWVYIIMNTLNKYTSENTGKYGEGYNIIYNLINNMFKLNYNLITMFPGLNICALDIFCIFVNDLQKIEEKLGSTSSVSNAVFNNITTTYVGKDLNHCVYSVLSKLKLRENNINEDIKNIFNLSAFSLSEENYIKTNEELIKIYCKNANDDSQLYGIIKYVYQWVAGAELDLNEAPSISKLDDDCVFYLDNNIKITNIHIEAKPEIKPIIEKITTTTIVKTPKTAANGLDGNWFKKNTVVVFLIDMDENEDGSQTYTFEYRKWNKYIKDWVDYGMETITINLPTALNWSIWKPRPSLDSIKSVNRITQRNLFKTSQNENETRKLINNDLNKLTATLNISNTSQGQNNAMLVDMINQLTGVINSMNNGTNKPVIKALSVNNNGLLVADSVFKKVDSDGKIVNMSTDEVENRVTTKITASESKPTSILDSNTLQTTIVGVTPTTKTTTKINLTK